MIIWQWILESWAQKTTLLLDMKAQPNSFHMWWLRQIWGTKPGLHSLFLVVRFFRIIFPYKNPTRIIWGIYLFSSISHLYIFHLNGILANSSLNVTFIQLFTRQNCISFAHNSFIFFCLSVSVGFRLAFLYVNHISSSGFFYSSVTNIIIIIIVTLWKFFTPALADSLSL